MIVAAMWRFSASRSPTYSITVLLGDKNGNGPRVVLIAYIGCAGPVPLGTGASKVVFNRRLRRKESSINFDVLESGFVLTGDEHCAMFR